jgi:hypothetical protein
MKKTAPAVVTLILGIAIGYFICKEYLCSECPSPPQLTGQGIITVDKAINLHENYKQVHYQVINDTLSSLTNSNFLDTQFVWFEYEKMKNYINYLETVQSKNPNNPKISGIRVYFGAYNDYEKYPLQQTVFFNPTIETTLDEKNNNMKNLPFYIIPDSPTDSLVGKYKVIQRLLLDEYNDIERAYMANTSLGHKNTREKSALKSSGAENGNGDYGTSLSFNLGHLSPPPPRN